MMSKSAFGQTDAFFLDKYVRLHSYSGELIPVLGSVDVTVTHKTQCHKVCKLDCS